MARLHLVRHGRVVDHLLDGSEDPPLSEPGHAQAASAADALAGSGADLLATSPYRRCRQTCEPIADALGLEPEIVAAVGEVVPEEYEAARRREFLQEFMGGHWSGQPDWLVAWRDGVLAALRELARKGDEIVVVSHTVAINVAAGAAMDDDRTTVFSPPNASISTFTVDNDRFTAIDLGTATHLPRA